MNTVAVAKLKAALSEYLSKVRAGGEVVVTDRGVPIAKLVPLAHERQAYSGLKDLAHAGLVRLPRRALSSQSLAKMPRVKDPQGKALKSLLEEREQGR